MTAQSTISLYTEEYYRENKAAIDTASRCGNIAELVTIDNYVYVAIKATEYPFDEEGTQVDYRQYNEPDLITDLDDLRAGVFSAYRMVVEQFLQVKNMQRTAGDSNDHVEFSRFIDDVYGLRWQLVLSNRDSVAAFSISVYNNAGAFLYTPGSFIDQGDGTWKVESNYQEYDDGDVNIEFIYGSEAITQRYHIDKDINYIGWDISYYEAGSTPIDVLDMDSDGLTDTVVLESGNVTVSEDDDSINIDLDGDVMADIVLPK